MTMRFVNDNLYPILATLIIIAAVICWFGAPEPTLPSTLEPAAEPWKLPDVIKRDSNKSIEIINARNLWGAVMAEVPKEPDWSVLGIVRSGVDWLLLLSVDDKPVDMLKVGDTLPDGKRIVQIENERFIVMTPDKRKLAFGIYKHDQIK